MNDEANAYIEYLLHFNPQFKREMPNFDVDAYTDIEYLNATDELNKEFDVCDDFLVSIKHLKGE